MVVNVLRGANACTVVTRCRKDICLLKYPGAGELARHNDVQRSTAGEANSIECIFILQIRHAEKDRVFEASL